MCAPAAPVPDINRKLRWSFYYFRRNARCGRNRFVPFIRTRCFGTLDVVARIANKHLVYLTRRIILVISQPSRFCFSCISTSRRPTENIRNSRTRETMSGDARTSAANSRAENEINRMYFGDFTMYLSVGCLSSTFGCA